MRPSGSCRTDLTACSVSCLWSVWSVPVSSFPALVLPVSSGNLARDLTVWFAPDPKASTSGVAVLGAELECGGSVEKRPVGANLALGV